MSQSFYNFEGETDIADVMAFESWSPNTSAVLTLEADPAWSDTPSAGYGGISGSALRFAKYIQVPDTSGIVRIYHVISPSTGNEANLYFAASASERVCYRVNLRKNGNQIGFSRYTPTQELGLGQASKTFNTSDVYKCLVYWNPSNGDLKVKIWEQSESEPGTWDFETNNTNITAHGGIGLNTFASLFSLSEIGIGTDGDDAPRSPVSGGITLSPASLRSASRLASPVVTQAHTIQPDDARSVSRLDTVQINQAHTISPFDARSETVLDATDLTQANNLGPDDARSATRLAVSLLTQSHIISPADLASASELDASILTQNGLLNPADSRSVNRLDASALMQDHIISPDDARSVSRLIVATLIAQGSISPDGLRCGTRLDSVLLVQANQLAPTDLLSASRLDPAVITQANVLQPDGVFSSSKLSAVQLTMAILVSPDSLWSTARLDSGSLTEANQLTVDDLVSPSRLETTNLFLIDAEVLGQLMVLPARRTMFNLPKRGTTFYLSGRN